jgi:hypothetical protein
LGTSFKVKMGKTKKSLEGINMRRVVVLALLALALPMAAWADNIGLTNQFGSISVSNAGVFTVGSELLTFGSFAAGPGHSLGEVVYSTGGLTGGTLAAGGTFSTTGSTFDVIGRGAWAKSLPGWSHGYITLFAGSFVSTGPLGQPTPLTWTLLSKVGQNLTYSLSGEVYGMLYTGRDVYGTTTQEFHATVKNLAAGKGYGILGATTLNTVPEPGTLGLLGAGLVGIAGLFRRKLIGS